MSSVSGDIQESRAATVSSHALLSLLVIGRKRTNERSLSDVSRGDAQAPVDARLQDAELGGFIPQAEGPRVRRRCPSTQRSTSNRRKLPTGSKTIRTGSERAVGCQTRQRDDRRWSRGNMLRSRPYTQTATEHRNGLQSKARHWTCPRSRSPSWSTLCATKRGAALSSTNWLSHRRSAAAAEPCCYE